MRGYGSRPFDDLPATLILEPFLTVVAQPAYEMGQRAAERLLARLASQVLRQW